MKHQILFAACYRVFGVDRNLHASVFLRIISSLTLQAFTYVNECKHAPEQSKLKERTISQHSGILNLSHSDSTWI